LPTKQSLVNWEIAHLHCNKRSAAQVSGFALATTLLERALINIVERLMLHTCVDFHQLGFVVDQI